MTNVNMLKEYILKSGYKIYFIAEKLGISYPCLQTRLNNKTDFRQTEIYTLCDLLNIDPDTRDKIFFAQSVDKLSTKEVI